MTDIERIALAAHTFAAYDERGSQLMAWDAEDVLRRYKAALAVIEAARNGASIDGAGALDDALVVWDALHSDGRGT